MTLPSLRSHPLGSLLPPHEGALAIGRKPLTATVKQLTSGGLSLEAAAGTRAGAK